MSEPQTEHETDPEPTPGPYRRGVTSARNRVILTVHRDNGKAHGDLYSVRHPVEDKEPVANLQLAEKAFTAAQKAREMGYDPQKAVEALPNLLSAAERMLNAVQSSDPSETGAQRPDGGAVMSLQGALASAEGSEE